MRKKSVCVALLPRTAYFGRIIRLVIAVIAAIGLVWVNLSLRFTAGSLIGTLILGAAFCAAAFWERLLQLIKRIWGNLFGKIGLCLCGAIIAAGVAMCVFFSVNMAVYVANPPLEQAADTDCVVVLGCQVKGETPSSMLCDRLNAALKLLQSSDKPFCVVSGGQGKDENISEAEAMQRYLLENGVLEERIILETRSESTEENLRFTAELLQQRGFDGKVTIVTNEYHQYRAHILAARAGIDASHYSARTSPRLIPNSWAREWAALAVTFLKEI